MPEQSRYVLGARGARCGGARRPSPRVGIAASRGRRRRNRHRCRHRRRRRRRRVARDGMGGVSKPRLLVHDTKCVLHLYEAITQRSRISDEKSVDRYSRRIKVVYNRIRIMMVMTGSFPR